MLECYSPAFLEDIIDPVSLVETLLEHKLKTEARTMGAKLRGCIYHTLGLLAGYYPDLLADKLPTLASLYAVKLREEIKKGAKTEERFLAGILKGLAAGLSFVPY